MATRRPASGNAIVYGRFHRDRSGRPVGLDDADSADLLAECGRSDADEEIFILRRKKLDCVEGVVVFKAPLLMVVRRTDGEFVADAPALQMSSVGPTKEEAISMLEELIVASCIHFGALPKGQLTSGGAAMKAALKRLVESAQGPGRA